METFLLFAILVTTSSAKTDSKTRTLKTAAFNVQVFGATYMRSKEQVDALLRIIRRYDVLAIQEVCNYCT